MVVPVISPATVSIPNKVYRFVVHGKPWAQKNVNIIRYRGTGKFKKPFLTHSPELFAAREDLAHTLYIQYKQQGGEKPISYHMEVEFIFYVESQHEPDMDNLPAIVCDALQGVKNELSENRKDKLAAVIEDDKLMRVGHITKIVRGDINYYGEPRTEVCIRRYYGSKS
jgi:hypothetical protein